MNEYKSIDLYSAYYKLLGFSEWAISYNLNAGPSSVTLVVNLKWLVQVLWSSCGDC